MYGSRPHYSAIVHMGMDNLRCFRINWYFRGLKYRLIPVCIVDMNWYDIFWSVSIWNQYLKISPLIVWYSHKIGRISQKIDCIDQNMGCIVQNIRQVFFFPLYFLVFYNNLGFWNTFWNLFAAKTFLCCWDKLQWLPIVTLGFWVDRYAIFNHGYC